MKASNPIDFADNLERDLDGQLAVPGFTSIILLYPDGASHTYTWKQADGLIRQLFDDSLRYYILDIDKLRCDNYWQPKFASDDIETYIFTLSENKHAETNITSEFVDVVYRILTWEEWKE